MAIKDAPDIVADGDQLNDGYFNGLPKFMGQDQTGGSAGGGGGAVTETLIGQVTITANKVTNGVLVIASGYANISDNDQTSTINLNSGTNADGITSATHEKTITRRAIGTDDAPNFDVGWTITKYITGLTWSSTQYISVTGSTNSTNTVACEEIVVLYF